MHALQIQEALDRKLWQGIFIELQEDMKTRGIVKNSRPDHITIKEASNQWNS